MFGRILTWLVGLIVVVIALGFVLPDKVKVERTTLIEAPRETVFALVGDFNRWNEWSPWAELDPNTKYVITGSGVGQRMEWSSKDPKVGEGSQEIAEFDPPARIVTKLDFGEMGGGVATLALAEENGGTRVVWTLETRMREGMPLLWKPVGTYMGFFMNGMVGKDYEKGLAKLKAAAESQS
jgi:uncharacterized protein YndB with AHSA1/START domain